MADYECDITLSYQYFNPFDNDPRNEKKDELVKTIMSDPVKFSGNIDPYEHSRYVILLGDNAKSVFGTNYSNLSSTDPNRYKIPPALKSRIQKLFCSMQGLPNDLRSWAGSPVVVEESDDDADMSEGEDAPNPYTMQGGDEAYQDAQLNDYLPNEPVKFMCNSNLSLTTYDASTDRCITYEDLRKIVINLARSRISTEIVKNENVLRMEEEKRKNLMKSINEYRQIKEIGAISHSDLTKMDIPQLEICLEEVKRMYEVRKNVEVFKRGARGMSTIYDWVFPEGIPISKTKCLKFNGVGDELLSTFFDERSTPGRAFGEILKKHNFHVSDEVMTLVVFAGAILSKVKVEDRVIDNDDDDVVVNPVGKGGSGKQIGFNGGDEDEGYEDEGEDEYEEDGEEEYDE